MRSSAYDTDSWMKRNTILITTTGSRLYGLATPGSDYDIAAVYLTPPWEVLGLAEPIRPKEHKQHKYDTVMYTVRSFVSLCLASNPTMLVVLFAPRDVWLYSMLEWELLYDIRHVFLSERIRKTYVGYAMSQLKRMQRHQSWIQTPPREPRLRDYGLRLETAKGGAQHFEVANRFRRSARIFARSVERYRLAKKEFDDYNTWVANRNPDRYRLEVAHGYDTKYAMHIFRLLITAKDILRDGDFSPRLSAESLEMCRAALRDDYGYDTFLDNVKTMSLEVSLMPTSIPNEPDVERVQEELARLQILSIRRWDKYSDLLCPDR